LCCSCTCHNCILFIFPRCKGSAFFWICKINSIYLYFPSQINFAMSFSARHWSRRMARRSVGQREED
jgi:hypothetical protein